MGEVAFGFDHGLFVLASVVFERLRTFRTLRWDGIRIDSGGGTADVMCGKGICILAYL